MPRAIGGKVPKQPGQLIRFNLTVTQKRHVGVLLHITGDPERLAETCYKIEDLVNGFRWEDERRKRMPTRAEQDKSIDAIVTHLSEALRLLDELPTGSAEQLDVLRGEQLTHKEWIERVAFYDGGNWLKQHQAFGEEVLALRSLTNRLRGGAGAQAPALHKGPARNRDKRLLARLLKIHGQRVFGTKTCVRASQHHSVNTFVHEVLVWAKVPHPDPDENPSKFAALLADE